MGEGEERRVETPTPTFFSKEMRNEDGSGLARSQLFGLAEDLHPVQHDAGRGFELWSVTMNCMPLPARVRAFLLLLSNNGQSRIQSVGP